jgi:hypothetical protein
MLGIQNSFMIEYIVFIILYVLGWFFVFSNIFKKHSILPSIIKKDSFAIGVVLLVYSFIWYFLTGLKDPWLDELLLGFGGAFLGWVGIKITSGTWGFITKTLPKLNYLLDTDFPKVKKQVEEIDCRVRKIERKKKASV